MSITNSQSSPKLMCIVSVMPSSHLILCRPLLLLPPIPPSIRVFANESTLHMRWPKYWSFSLSISPSNEHPELVSLRMDWLDLLAVQESSPTPQYDLNQISYTVEVTNTFKRLDLRDRVPGELWTEGRDTVQEAVIKTIHKKKKCKKAT